MFDFLKRSNRVAIKARMSYAFIVLITILTSSVSAPNVLADVSLPQLFSDNMILQRDKPVRIWGWADEGEKVTMLVMPVMLNN